ncbi:MAG: adenosine deaminase [Pseudomonadota bacterium]
MTWRSVPKVELHLHLEGAAPPRFIAALAREKSLDLSSIFDGEGGYLYRDFWHFLEVYETACRALQTPEDFYRLTLEVMQKSASHGVVYTETFVSPDFCGGRDIGAWREYLAAMQQASREGEARFGTTLRGIATCLRHLGPEPAVEVARCAAATAGDWLVGFGMAGDELQHAPRDFVRAFDIARDAGLGITVHAGEWGGAASVRDALDALRPARIGHGVQAIDDAALVARLAEEGVVLECCPGSNVVLGVYETWAAHPIDRLRQAGVPVTVSTDDPPFFAITMTSDYANLAETFGWGQSDFQAVAKTAIEAAFCDAETRKKIIDRLEQP